MKNIFTLPQAGSVILVALKSHPGSSRTDLLGILTSITISSLLSSLKFVLTTIIENIRMSYMNEWRWIRLDPDMVD